MFVWIPRYAYSIETGYHSSGAGTIGIEFLVNSSNKDEEGNEYSTTYDATTLTVGGSTPMTVHPAFTFGEDELAGFWMAKFEASEVTTDTIAVLPNVDSCRSKAISIMFTNCLNMNNDDNDYKITEEIDTHLTQNSEWGAVAYLAHSSYGRNGTEVIQNDSGFYTGGNDYVTNKLQSTTGNVYGVYDMSGGANEYVAAYLKGTTSSYVSTFTAVDTKYSEIHEAYINSIIGDAVYETSASGSSPYTNSWNLDYSCFPTSSISFFVRGGNFLTSDDAGIFSFYNSPR